MIEVGAQYRHSKSGKVVTIIALAKHSETLEDLVVYEEPENELARVWVRPQKMFEEKVELPVGSGTMVLRFEPIKTHNS